MKLLAMMFLICGSLISYGQNLKESEKRLSDNFSKIHYWAFYKDAEADTTKFSHDSVEKYNRIFEKELLQIASTNVKSISYNFQSLRDSGLRIVTSKDGLFRIYTWDTWMGGTMHYFENILQYNTRGEVRAEQRGDALKDDIASGYMYYGIDDIASGDKTFYLTLSGAVLSSALSDHNVKFFSIDNGVLNDDAKLIKTRTGIRNELGYEVDLSSSANRDRDAPDFSIEYDSLAKIISIPVILDNNKVTSRRIKYKFTGKYFEKL
ncbi:MAG TPA: hypothetical protein VG738_23710 [Chitinophagaceae bacterium]|nr:hypothetical protein [Chitinophagaceae bacterium]